MADTAVAVNRLQTLQIALDFPTKITFDRKLAFRDCLDDFVEIVGGQVLRPNVGIDGRLLQNALCRCRPNSVNVRQGRLNSLISWDINS
jgi:hypothetical protein